MSYPLLFSVHLILPLRNSNKCDILAFFVIRLQSLTFWMYVERECSGRYCDASYRLRYSWYHRLQLRRHIAPRTPPRRSGPRSAQKVKIVSCHDRGRRVRRLWQLNLLALSNWLTIPAGDHGDTQRTLSSYLFPSCLDKVQSTTTVTPTYKYQFEFFFHDLSGISFLQFHLTLMCPLCCALQITSRWSFHFDSQL